MLRRCYDEKSLVKKPSYKNCYVCDEWLKFSNFKKWFDENYIKNYCLDKDLFSDVDKIYSPQTCCFIPMEINCFLVKSKNRRGDYPIGVVFRKDCKKFMAQVYINGENKILGTFNDEISAFNRYKEEKEKQAKIIAEKWKGIITDRVYQKLYNYTVNIDD